ncbi:transglutaminase-like superfamily protein [Diplocarpon rosae]|nr:transglutaminase-like superfamily protein [Diplocarpon rosae]
MAEGTVEPQFTSLQARIAALNQQSNGKPMAPGSAGKRPPPPPRPADRPNLPTRNTINNPPIASSGSSVSQRPNNQPLGARGQTLLPPPPVDRDQLSQPTAKAPPLPARNAPPPLPTRKASQPSPALPPRKVSTQLVPGTQMVRRGSNASTISHSSTVSGMSLGYGSRIMTVSSGDGRRLPPALGDATLPPLPPTKRELEEKAKIAKAKDSTRKLREKESQTQLKDEASRFEKVALVKVRSVPEVSIRPRNCAARSLPSLPARESSLVEKVMAPRMPPRPNGPPGLPERPRSRNSQAESIPPPHPARRLPPPSTAARSILQMGFGNRQTETPNEVAPAPRLPVTRPGLPVTELNADNFYSTIEGKYALIDFYGPRCSDCVRIAATYQKVGEDFAFASDKLVIAKVNGEENNALMHKYGGNRYPAIVFFDGSGNHPEKYPWPDYPQEWEAGHFTQFLEEKTGIKVSDRLMMPPNSVPPPINLRSKPSAREVKAIQARATAPTSGCLRCRDFSGPDGLAAQYPRQSLPKSHDLTGYLADMLCAPFSSATDKARAIFTWLHHNIAYDVDAFFGNRVKHVEPKDTIATGLAVCGGYAGLFAAIALKAGMEAVVVTGHGKGFGYRSLKRGERPPPPDPSGHAWNAVRVDGGEWKLIDPCWGAGNVSGSSYNKNFTPSQFTMPNSDFGLKHFPADSSHFFLAGRRIPTWEEYMIGPCGEEPPQIYGDAESKNFLDVNSFSPPQKRIRVSGAAGDEIVRFQFSKMCEHWDHEKNGAGKPYVMVLKVEGVGGCKEDFVPFEKTDFWWYLDIRAKELGTPGQTISVFSVNSVEGSDARGLSTQDYVRKKGKVAMGPFGGIAAWDLV